MVELLLAQKERAALDETRLLAAIPIGIDGHLYLLLDRQSGQGRALLGRPDSSDPDAQQLWDALHRNFAGELKAPVAATFAAPRQVAQPPAGQPGSMVGSGR